MERRSSDLHLKVGNYPHLRIDGELISKHPLLIQKALADKLSDKISVIIAPPGTDGRSWSRVVSTN